MDTAGLHFEKLSLNFSKFSYPSYEQNQKCAMDYSSCQKLIDVLVLNFKVTFSAHVKVRKKGFLLDLAKCTEKQKNNKFT